VSGRKGGDSRGRAVLESEFQQSCGPAGEGWWWARERIYYVIRGYWRRKIQARVYFAPAERLIKKGTCREIRGTE